MTTFIVLGGIAIYVLLFFLYGKKVERDVVKASDQRETPAKRLQDGLDYVPTRPDVLFGHHFAAIAGAAPIVGPAIAIVWGWVPALLWVWFGNIFVGAIHDYLALMASVRYDGKSIQFVSADLLGKRTGKTFYLIVFCLLLLVVAALSSIVAQMFVADGAIASTYLWITGGALIFGYLLYHTRIGITSSTIVGIAMMAGATALGIFFPVNLGFNGWVLIFFFYIIIAAALPVNVLLQPRDYLNSFVLYAGLIMAIVGAVFALKEFEVPAFSGFAPLLLAGKATPFWPAIPLIIACGALSGFHSLVASGTTSKQLRKESDALAIGMGGMYMEGFLSTIVIVSIAGFGYTAIKNAGVAMNIPIALDASNWATMFTKTTNEVHLSQANLFIQSFTDMIGATWLAFIPTSLVKVIAGLWVSSFAMTTLDAANRISRYCLTELCSPLRGRSDFLHDVLTNRWIASLIPAAIGSYLAWSGDWLVIWGAVGATNQLIAAVALMTGAAYVSKRLKSRFANVALVPALLLWVTVFSATLWMLVVVMPADIAANPGPGWTVAVITAVMLVMNVVFILDFFKSYFGKAELPPVDTVQA